MSFANDILDAIEIMVKQVVEDNATKIYTGVCKTIGTGNCVLTINGKDNTVKYYGGVPVVGTVYQVFIPFGNMSAAFIIVPGSGGGSGGSGVDSVNGKTGNVVLNAADVGLGNVDNIKQYSASNPPPYPVVSVNGKTGGVNLIASDVGAAPAGYGLGTSYSPEIDDCDTATKNGWYHVKGATLNKPFNKVGALLVACRGSTQMYQLFFVGETYATGGSCIIVRSMYGGEWGPWEWVNPPMEVGVEYRTTERYLGKPVYAKAMTYTFTSSYDSASQFGLEIPHEISNFGSLVRAEAVSPPYMIPYVSKNGGFAGVRAVNATNILFDSYKTGWSSGNKIMFKLFYTKS